MERQVIDFHVHFPARIYPDSIYQNQFDYSIDSILEEMKLSGTEFALISSIEPMLRSSWANLNERTGKKYGGNKLAAEAIKSSQGKLIGAFVPNCFQTSKQIKNDIALFVGNYNFKAIKLHPWLGGYPANIAQLNPVFEISHELNLPILYHSGTIPFTTPAEIFDMAKKYPEVIILMGHAGGTELWHDVFALAKYADNLLIETSGQSNKIYLEKFIEKYGSKRVLYGSDWLGTPGKMFFRQLEIDELNITDDKKEDIFSQNAKRILNL